ncbi:MAG: zinc ribbon domain-containing protein [Pelomonas sp.]|nr:zinc ribbon domain-containing protein [Roseateles sp.]
MSLDNYRDLSSGGSDVNAGFQFEFFCTNCDRKWKSPFQPYRRGQFSALLARFYFMFNGGAQASRVSTNLSDMGSRGAKEDALNEAQARAQTMYVECPHCHQGVCTDCFDERQGACPACLAKEQQQNQVRQAEAAAATCPNCHAPHAGGRFCGECGFDMASTHKSCPGCGAMALRGARFCTDCGHSF